MKRQIVNKQVSEYKYVFNIKNKVDVITGGSCVLRCEMVIGLLKSCTKVVLLGTNKQKIKVKLKILDKAKKDVIGLICNVLDKESIQSFDKIVLDKFGR